MIKTGFALRYYNEVRVFETIETIPTNFEGEFYLDVNNDMDNLELWSKDEDGKVKKVASKVV